LATSTLNNLNWIAFHLETRTGIDVMTIRRITVVVNPRSGTKHGHTVLHRVKPIFEGAGIELDVRATQHQGQASEIARNLDLRRRKEINYRIFSLLMEVFGNSIRHENHRV
jgi:hypothetical protein